MMMMMMMNLVVVMMLVVVQDNSRSVDGCDGDAKPAFLGVALQM